ncbi:peptidoglycan-binding protein [Clostridium botulinum]|uniref:GH25 family lysozyme n=1 Tax=Clostridium botulinum TaxID=1491 RepID=UPI001C9A87B4|nr:GH25 family lysozyme [Clostridium botulinum]MBY6846737.1 peptidoglycan-binding protein [Clostridium botulinum]
MLKGIDISMHNGNIDFKGVKNVGVNIVIIKATEGVQYIDPLLEQHYQGAKAQNLNIGFYHFMSEKTSPTQQAIDFWNSIKDKNFNVIPTLDIETNNMGRSQRQISDRCIEFLEKFKNLSGYNCMIYAGGYFGRDNLDSRVKKYLGWIAHYGVDRPMETGFNVVGHQYSENGHINGVNGYVDMNNFIDKIFIDEKQENNNSTSTIYGSHYLIKEFQKEINNQGFGNIEVHGIAGDATLNACPLVRKGAKGGITKVIQKMLISIGYPVGSTGADCIFGNGTEIAIKALQKDCKLSIDGIVGRETWKALFRNLK